MKGMATLPQGNQQCWICQIFPGGPLPSLLFPLPLPSSLPYPSRPLPFSAPTLPFLSLLPSLPLPSPPLEVGPLFAARGRGGALKLPTGSGQSPAAKRFLMLFSRRI